MQNKKAMQERFVHYCIDDPSRREFGKRLLGLLAGIGLLGRETAQKKQIMMNTFSIAGFQYHHGLDHLDQLHIGQSLHLSAEPENPHDEFAVKIITRDGLALGYVPRSDNKAISRFVIGGLRLTAQISAIHPDAPHWQQVQVKVAMTV
jgi:hypothetical protein